MIAEMSTDLNRPSIYYKLQLIYSRKNRKHPSTSLCTKIVSTITLRTHVHTCPHSSPHCTSPNINLATHPTTSADQTAPRKNLFPDGPPSPTDVTLASAAPSPVLLHLLLRFHTGAGRRMKNSSPSWLVTLVGLRARGGEGGTRGATTEVIGADDGRFAVFSPPVLSGPWVMVRSGCCRWWTCNTKEEGWGESAGRKRGRRYPFGLFWYSMWEKFQLALELILEDDFVISPTLSEWCFDNRDSIPRHSNRLDAFNRISRQHLEYLIRQMKTTVVQFQSTLKLILEDDFTKPLELMFW